MIKCETGVRYSDDGERTKMDIYYPKSYTKVNFHTETWNFVTFLKGTQIFMFIHGGYWQECGLDQTGSFAKSVTDMGLIYVGVSYDLCPKLVSDNSTCMAICF